MICEITMHADVCPSEQLQLMTASLLAAALGMLYVAHGVIYTADTHVICTRPCFPLPDAAGNL
jgi:hypothetical protein